MRRCWQTQQPECSRAWNASLERLSHRLHSSRTISWEFFYIIDPYLVLYGDLFGFQTSVYSCLYAAGLPQVLSPLFCICLHTFTSRHQPAHTYETGGASGWVNMYSVLSHTPTLSHQHTQSPLPPLHPPKHSPIGSDVHQLRMNEQFQCCETPALATWWNVLNRKFRHRYMGTGSAGTQETCQDHRDEIPVLFRSLWHWYSIFTFEKIFELFQIYFGESPPYAYCVLNMF